MIKARLKPAPSPQGETCYHVSMRIDLPGSPEPHEVVFHTFDLVGADAIARAICAAAYDVTICPISDDRTQ